MKILHVTHQYYPAIGGSEKYITDLSEELVLRGHKVDVFTTRSTDYHTWENHLSSHEEINGVGVYRFAGVRRSKSAWTALRIGQARYWKRRFPLYQPMVWYGNGPISPNLWLALLARSQQYDICHVNQLHYAHSWPAYRIARFKDIPYLVTPHVHPEQRDTFDFAYLNGVLEHSAVTFAVTRPEQRFLKALHPDNDIVVGGNGLKLQRCPIKNKRTSRSELGIPDDAFVILFLGRKTEYKGLDTSLSAFFGIRQSVQRSFFIAAGPETDFSAGFWQRIDNPASLIVLDRVSELEKWAVLSAADVLVLPSIGEAFGIVYLEAWACGIPVIGSSIPAVSSIVDDGENGFLIPPGDVECLQDRLIRLARHPELRERLGRNGRKKLERRFTVEAISDIVEGTYQRIRRRRQDRHVDLYQPAA